MRFRDIPHQVGKSWQCPLCPPPEGQLLCPLGILAAGGLALSLHTLVSPKGIQLTPYPEHSNQGPHCLMPNGHIPKRHSQRAACLETPVPALLSFASLELARVVITPHAASLCLCHSPWGVGSVALLV